MDLYRPHPVARGLLAAAGIVVLLTLASVIALVADVWGQLPAGLLLVLLLVELTGVVFWVRSRRGPSAVEDVPEAPAARPSLSLVE